WDDPFLRVVEAVYPYILIGERPSSNTLPRKTREAEAELVDRSRRENVSLGDCQIPVLKGAERREARHSGAEERKVLIGVGKEELHRQLIRRAQVDVEICIELVFVIVPRQNCGVVHTATRSLRTWDDKCSIWVLRVQKIERYRVNIRAIRGYGHASECPGFASECSSKRGWCASLRYRRKAQRANTAA